MVDAALARGVFVSSPDDDEIFADAELRRLLHLMFPCDLAEHMMECPFCLLHVAFLLRGELPDDAPAPPARLFGELNKLRNGDDSTRAWAMLLNLRRSVTTLRQRGFRDRRHTM
jgi:hypothetical protein